MLYHYYLPHINHVNQTMYLRQQLRRYLGSYIKDQGLGTEPSMLASNLCKLASGELPNFK